MSTNTKALTIRLLLLAVFLFSIFELKHSLEHVYTILSPLPRTLTAKEVFIKKILPRITNKKNEFVLKNAPFSIVKHAEAEQTTVEASAYLLADLDTGQIIAGKSAQAKLPIASLTKIMSAVIALDLAQKNDLFAITEKAATVTPTRIGVVPGQEMRMEELVRAMLMTSANDAAEAVRDGVDRYYQSSVFVDAMNEKARFLGLASTHFANPQGFDNKKNYSSANDLAILIHYAYENYPFFTETVKKDYDFLPENNLHKQFDLPNWNGLIDVYLETVGVKIGNTEEAGMTTAVVSQRGGKRLLAIVLGAPDIFSRDLAAAELLNDGYEKTLNLPPATITRSQLQEKYRSWYKN